MKTLISTLFAGLFVLAVASMASAGSCDVHGGSALDSNGVAVVALHSPSAPLTISSVDRTYLDSNHIWYVSEVKNVSTTEMANKGMDKSTLVCFDSINRFCARSY